MGCDIHMFVESKSKDGKYWFKAGKEFKDSYFDPKKPMSDYNEITTDEPYQGRNYSLFALLADVRNDHDLTPLSEPKGLPKDVSEEIKEKAEEWGGDGHSHSYFTLQELLDIDWDFTVIPQAGLVDKKNYDLFKLTNRPYEWCQGTNQTDYHKIKWNVSLREFMRDFIDVLYELRYWGKLKELEPKDIRLVFWFDN